MRRVSHLAALFLVAMPAIAAATPLETRVATAFEKGNPIDLHLSLGFTTSSKSARIRRELQQLGVSNDAIALVNDLAYSQTRNLMSLRAAVGFAPGVELHLELPFVLSDSRTVSFFQEGGPESRVDARNSTSVRDGTLPASGEIPQGPGRSGLETFNIGLKAAILEQRKDDTKPTWTAGVDFKIHFGETQAFDRRSPTANTKVGPGYHTIRFRTDTSRRLGPVEPFFGIFFDLPIASDKKAFPTAIGGQREDQPQMASGATFGLDARFLERPELLVGGTLRARAEARFKGRGWSEMWEQLSCSSADIDADSQNGRLRPTCVLPDGRTSPYAGTTDIENYGSFAADLEVWTVWKDLLRGAVGFGLNRDQAHFITYAGAGQDRNNNGQVELTDANEFNPQHRQVIDLVGRRYRVDGVMVWRVLFTIESLF